MGFKNKKIIRFVPLTLNEENAQAIFNRCLEMKEDIKENDQENQKTGKYNTDRLAANAIQTKYLIGQLAVVHKMYEKVMANPYKDILDSKRYDATKQLDYESDWYSLDREFFFRYDGKLWTDTTDILFNLLNLGIAVNLIEHKSEDGKEFVRFCSVVPTYFTADQCFSEADVKMFEADFRYHEEKYSEAAGLYEKAAELGNMRAQYQCGRMYLEGEYTIKSVQKAVDWFKKAADQGMGDAMSFLGDIYYLGAKNEMPVDKTAALQWYQRAAEAGEKTAVSLLEYAYDEADEDLLDSSAVFDKMLADFDSYQSLTFRMRQWLSDCFSYLNYDQKIKFFSINEELAKRFANGW